LIEWHRAAETAAVTSLWNCPREVTVTATADAGPFDHGMLTSQAWPRHAPYRTPSGGNIATAIA